MDRFANSAQRMLKLIELNAPKVIILNEIMIMTNLAKRDHAELWEKVVAAFEEATTDEE